MVRVRDEDKARDRAQKILEAATKLFARQGVWATPTSAISKAAGIADGTLFTYFKTKDALINALYKSLKAEFVQGLAAEFSALEDDSPHALRGTLRLMWDGYLSWALEHPRKHAVMGQLRVSPAITQDTREEAARPFIALEARARAAMEAKVLREQSFEFLAAMFAGVAEATVAYIAELPPESAEREKARDAGFLTLWNGIAYAEPAPETSFSPLDDGDLP